MELKAFGASVFLPDHIRSTKTPRLFLYEENKAVIYFFQNHELSQNPNYFLTIRMFNS